MKNLNEIFEKWIDILRMKNNWDIKLDLISDKNFNKTGDIKIDCEDRKAIVMINILNPKQENLEEVICHELLHLKLYPLDQFTESLITSTYEEGSKAMDLAYSNFFMNLEITVEELTKCYLEAFGDDKNISYGRCKNKKSFNELYDGLNDLK